MKDPGNVAGLLRPVPQLITLKEPGSLISEQYRILIMRLLQMRKNRTLQVIGVTSSIQGEGKTTAALNLAITMAKTYQMKTLLIEADTKNPSFGTVLSSTNGGGLSEVLNGIDPYELLKYDMNGKLAILTVGRPTIETMAGFTPETLQVLLDKLRSDFPLILLDSPPVLPLADMTILSDVVDGILFLVQAHRTPRAYVSKALSMLPREKVLGLVFNNLQVTAPFSYYSYVRSTGRKP